MVYAVTRAKMTEVERLNSQLAEAKAENDQLRRQLDNATLLLKQEMFDSGKLKLPKRPTNNGDVNSN
jgi:hypothetical protein